jgi:hypothetical protein
MSVSELIFFFFSSREVHDVEQKNRPDQKIVPLNRVCQRSNSPTGFLKRVFSNRNYQYNPFLVFHTDCDKTPSVERDAPPLLDTHRHAGTNVE